MASVSLTGISHVQSLRNENEKELERPHVAFDFITKACKYLETLRNHFHYSINRCQKLQIYSQYLAAA